MVSAVFMIEGIPLIIYYHQAPKQFMWSLSGDMAVPEKVIW